MGTSLWDQVLVNFDGIEFHSPQFFLQIHVPRLVSNAYVRSHQMSHHGYDGFQKIYPQEDNGVMPSCASPMIPGNPFL